MTLEESIKRYTDNAEYERTHRNLQGYVEFKQLVKWLTELRAYRKMYHKEYVDDCLRAESAEMECGVCKGCHYNDGEVHAECVVCDKAEMEGEE